MEADKLVRDRIPEIIERSGRKPVVKKGIDISKFEMIRETKAEEREGFGKRRLLKELLRGRDE